MSSDKHCCVPGCKDSGGTNAVLHKFPNPETERERFNTWLYAIGGDVLTLENEHIYKYRRVCRSHFMHKYLCRNNKLSNIAVPTLNMPDVLSKMKFGLHEEKTTQKGETGLVQPCSSSDPGILLEQQVYNKPLFAKKCVNIEISAARKDNPDPRVKELPVPVYECLQIENNEKENCDPGVKESPVPVQIENDKKESCNPGVKEPVNESLQIENKEKENCSFEETPEKPVLMDISNINASCLQPAHASTSSHASQPASLPRKTTKTSDEASASPPVKKRKGTYKDDNKVLSEMLKKMTKKKENYAARLKKAQKLSENTTFLNIMKKFTTFAAIFIALQFREIKNKKMGRRFTDDEKVMALSIYKNGPKCYRLLSKFFVLPSYMTLSRLIARANLRAGINEKLFKIMKKKVKNMRADDKLCVLLFDEVAISPHFDYNRRKDEIEGFVTNGSNRERKIADHALVFMIRGVMRNYKQPIAYTFCC